MKSIVSNYVDQIYKSSGLPSKEVIDIFSNPMGLDDTQGTVFEINTGTVGGPGIIENTKKLSTYLANKKSGYAAVLADTLSLDTQQFSPSYHTDYIHAHMKQRGSSQIITISDSVNERRYTTQKGRRLINKFAQQLYPALEFPHTIIHALELEAKGYYDHDTAEKTLFLSHYDPGYLAPESSEKHQLLSKMHNSIGGQLLTQPYKELSDKGMLGKFVPQQYMPESFDSKSTNFDTLDITNLRKTHVLKVAHINQGQGVFMPGKWSKSTLRSITKEGMQFCLQAFKPMPTKLTINQEGTIEPNRIDLRAFVTIYPDRSHNVNLLGKSSNIGKVSNASSGGTFTDIRVVPDDAYHDTVQSLWESAMHMSKIEKEDMMQYITRFRNRYMFMFRDMQMSPIPHLLSQTSYDKIHTLTKDIVDTLFAQ